MALSTASFAVALTSRQATGAVVAGTLMGAAALLRDEALLLIPGLLLVTWLRLAVQRGPWSPRAFSWASSCWRVSSLM